MVVSFVYTIRMVMFYIFVIVNNSFKAKYTLNCQLFMCTSNSRWWLMVLMSLRPTFAWLLVMSTTSKSSSLSG